MVVTEARVLQDFHHGVRRLSSLLPRNLSREERWSTPIDDALTGMSPIEHYIDEA